MKFADFLAWMNRFDLISGCGNLLSEQAPVDGLKSKMAHAGIGNGFKQIIKFFVPDLGGKSNSIYIIKNPFLKGKVGFLIGEEFIPISFSSKEDLEKEYASVKNMDFKKDIVSVNEIKNILQFSRNENTAAFSKVKLRNENGNVLADLFRQKEKSPSTTVNITEFYENSKKIFDLLERGEDCKIFKNSGPNSYGMSFHKNIDNLKEIRLDQIKDVFSYLGFKSGDIEKFFNSKGGRSKTADGIAFDETTGEIKSQGNTVVPNISLENIKKLLPDFSNQNWSVFGYLLGKKSDPKLIKSIRLIEKSNKKTLLCSLENGDLIDEDITEKIQKYEMAKSILSSESLSLGGRFYIPSFKMPPSTKKLKSDKEDYGKEIVDSVDDKMNNIQLSKKETNVFADLFINYFKRNNLDISKFTSNNSRVIYSQKEDAILFNKLRDNPMFSSNLLTISLKDNGDFREAKEIISNKIKELKDNSWDYFLIGYLSSFFEMGEEKDIAWGSFLEEYFKDKMADLEKIVSGDTFVYYKPENDVLFKSNNKVVYVIDLNSFGNSSKLAKASSQIKNNYLKKIVLGEEDQDKEFFVGSFISLFKTSWSLKKDSLNSKNDSSVLIGKKIMDDFKGSLEKYLHGISLKDLRIGSRYGDFFIFQGDKPLVPYLNSKVTLDSLKAIKEIKAKKTQDPIDINDPNEPYVLKLFCSDDFVSFLPVKIAFARNGKKIIALNERGDKKEVKDLVPDNFQRAIKNIWDVLEFKKDFLSKMHGGEGEEKKLTPRFDTEEKRKIIESKWFKDLAPFIFQKEILKDWEKKFAAPSSNKKYDMFLKKSLSLKELEKSDEFKKLSEEDQREVKKRLLKRDISNQEYFSMDDLVGDLNRFKVQGPEQMDLISQFLSLDNFNYLRRYNKETIEKEEWFKKCVEKINGFKSEIERMFRNMPAVKPKSTLDRMKERKVKIAGQKMSNNFKEYYSGVLLEKTSEDIPFKDIRDIASYLQKIFDKNDFIEGKEVVDKIKSIVASSSSGGKEPEDKLIAERILAGIIKNKGILENKSNLVRIYPLLGYVFSNMSIINILKMGGKKVLSPAQQINFAQLIFERFKKENFSISSLDKEYILKYVLIPFYHPEVILAIEEENYFPIKNISKDIGKSEMGAVLVDNGYHDELKVNSNGKKVFDLIMQ